ncbi:Spy/CpxP family protein refolding chaperone [Reyranella sp.]|jgi:Spy/CpxP family protein refolding chaperone|uniref:Spy/CpxP family protein refolding chaperone n=1 Tax=Reyranella sp. TaxID=1929291 RepID=UPI0037843840
MNKWMLAAVAALFFAPQMAWPQASQPYSGLEARPIRALSDQQIADLKAGRGMSLALAAELNGYPGPLHVLELAERLGLTPGQRDRMARLFEAMKSEAVVLGERLIASEASLDRQFAGKTITEASLADGVQATASVQAALRIAHLKYHLATVEVLTPEQVARYNELRGYAGGEAKPHRH